MELTPSGPVLASGAEKNGLIQLRIKTRLLPTNRVSRPVVVYGNNQQTKSLFFRLKIDNTPPRLLYLRTHRTPSGRLVWFRVSEKSQLRIAGGGPRYQHWVWVARHRLIKATLPGSVRHARLILRDRAGNTLHASSSGDLLDGATLPAGTRSQERVPPSPSSGQEPSSGHRSRLWSPSGNDSAT